VTVPRSAAAGAQRERTSLAWRRTALAFAVNGVLLLRANDAWVEIAGMAVLAASTAMAAAASARFRDRDTHGWLGGRSRRGAVLVAIVAAVSLLDLIAIVR
jgi:uncharacterized membrane protein YidH (DUF202 family)